MDNYQIASPALDAYLHSILPTGDPVLKTMERYAARIGFPIVGPLVGRFLYQMTLVSGAKRVLELGSGFGYSAYWFGLATGKGGKIILTDTDGAKLRRAASHFSRGGLRATFFFHEGDALDFAAHLTGPFDLILNDVDKEAYPDTIELAARLLRPGGLFITDNVLWSGRVFSAVAADAATRRIRRFTRMLYRDRRFFTSLVPLRDGLAVAVRLP